MPEAPKVIEGWVNVRCNKGNVNGYRNTFFDSINDVPEEIRKYYVRATLTIHPEKKEDEKIEVWQWRFWCRWDGPADGWRIAADLMTKERAKESFEGRRHEIHAGPFLVSKGDAE